MRKWLVVAAINGFLAVLAGAFATHALAARLDAHMLDVFQTGARYHMYHALALGLIGMQSPARWLKCAGWCFTLGIILFSGSLYLLAVTGISWLGAVTPFGGALFLAGWALLGWSARQHQDRQ